MEKTDVVKLILSQIEGFNETLETPLDISEDSGCVLFGDGSPLSSIDFVTLILDLENALEEKFARPMTLADERAISQKNSPFRTVDTLADYILKLMEE